jgi:hypothetical protein
MLVAFDDTAQCSGYSHSPEWTRALRQWAAMLLAELKSREQGVQW